MSKGNTFEADIIAYAFNATAFSWNANTQLFVALHTADPGEAGNQTTNEVSYTGYARVAVNRNSGGWTCTGNAATNTALVQFPQCTGGSATATHISIGTATSGTGQILWSGALGSSLAISNGIQPQFAASTINTSED